MGIVKVIAAGAAAGVAAGAGVALAGFAAGLAAGAGAGLAFAFLGGGDDGWQPQRLMVH